MPQRIFFRINPRAQPNLGATDIEALVTQRVTEALADRNFESRQGGGTRGDSTQGGSRNHPRACSYKEFMFAACTFKDVTMSWWNAKPMGVRTSNSISWDDLNKLLTEEYYPKEEMQKLEQELWNLTMQDIDIAAYTGRFSDLSIFFPSFVTPKYKKLERPTTYDSAKRPAFTLTNQVIRQGTMAIKSDLLGSKNSKRKPDEDQSKK
uniref:Retrotransposon gag domain-containing protein n=1 Tax=Lactuca sativa TaxID=4236 RepID=A0A9R1V7I3_LACSA|nr:hypothetical protein LSAT_V11C600321180 [Lactuca sativa]